MARFHLWHKQKPFEGLRENQLLSVLSGKQKGHVLFLEKLWSFALKSLSLIPSTLSFCFTCVHITHLGNNPEQ
jgi:hypothetical protein